MSHKIKILDDKQYSALVKGDKGDRNSNIKIFFASILPGLFYSVTDLIVDRNNIKYIYIPPEELEYRYSPAVFDRIAFKKLDLYGEDIPIDDKVFVPIVVENIIMGGFYGDYEDFRDIDREDLISATAINDYFGMVFNAAPPPATSDLAVRLLDHIASSKSVDWFMRGMPEWILEQIGEGQVGFYYKVGDEYYQRRVIGMLGDFGELPGIIEADEAELIEQNIDNGCSFIPLGAVPTRATEIKYPPQVRFAIRGHFDESLEYLLIGIIRGITDYLPALFVERLSEAMQGLSTKHFGRDVEWSRILSAADELLNSGKSYDLLAELLLRELNDYLNINRISLTRYNHLENRIEILGSAQLNGGTPLAVGTTFPAGGTEFETVLETGKYYIGEFKPSQLKSRTLFKLYKDGVRTYITIPVRVEGNVYGFLNVGSPMAGEYLKRYMNIFEALARYLAGIEQASDYGKQTRVLSDHIDLLEQKLSTIENMRTLGELAGGVFHDLNNALGAILGRSQLIQTKAAKAENDRIIEKIAKDAALIEKSAVDSGQILDRLRQLTRPGRRKQHKAVDFNSLVEDSLEIIRPRWQKLTREKGIKLTLEKDLKLEAVVNVDPSEIREVLTNILLNALDAMPEGGTIAIGSRYRGEHIELYISDTGEGIKPDLRDKIFDSFFTTKGEKGTGLGLSLSKKIIENHGGKISFKPGHNGGTTFIISLPISSDKRLDPELSVNNQASHKNLSVLIVEDRPDLQETTKELLEASDFDVKTATSGEEAIQKCGQYHFDVIITDFGLPGISGLELAEHAKRVDDRLKVILISGWEIDQSVSELMDRGVDSLLTKPFRKETILEAIGALIPASKARHPAS